MGVCHWAKTSIQQCFAFMTTYDKLTLNADFTSSNLGFFDLASKIEAQKIKAKCLGGLLCTLETRECNPFSQDWYHFLDKARKGASPHFSQLLFLQLGNQETLICNTETTPWISPSTVNSQRSSSRYKSLRQILLGDAMVVIYILRQNAFHFIYSMLRLWRTT